MDSSKLSCEDKAEILRKTSRYRELILSGRLRLSHRSAAQLLGPDCMYHLYSLGACPSIRRGRAHGACTASARREEEAMRGHR